MWNVARLRLSFSQSNPRKLWVREEAERHLSPGRCTVPPCHVFAHNTKVVEGNMREQRAAGTVSHSPDVRHARLHPFIHLDVSIRRQLNTSLFQTNSGGIRRAPRRNENVTALDGVLCSALHVAQAY